MISILGPASPAVSRGHRRTPVFHVRPRLFHGDWGAFEGKAATHPVHYVEDDAHGHAELLEIQIAVIIDIGDVPDALELVIPQATVLQERRGLFAGQELAAIRPRREDVPVCLDLLRLNPRGHCRARLVAANGRSVRIVRCLNLCNLGDVSSRWVGISETKAIKGFLCCKMLV